MSHFGPKSDASLQLWICSNDFFKICNHLILFLCHATLFIKLCPLDLLLLLLLHLFTSVIKYQAVKDKCKFFVKVMNKFKIKKYIR